MGSSSRTTLRLLYFFTFAAIVHQFDLMLRSTHDLDFQHNAIDDLPREAGEVGMVMTARRKECFPPRKTAESNPSYNVTTVYIEASFMDLHLETFYSFIDRLCSCSPSKPPIWTLNNENIPHFFIGPSYFLSPGARRILEKFNETTCGPIYIDTPTINPDLTVFTTTYTHNFLSGKKLHLSYVNDPRYLLICHGNTKVKPKDREAKMLENMTNVFFLTPHHDHQQYIVPSYFPPSFVDVGRPNSKKDLVFVVMGGSARGKRNLASLVGAMDFYKDEHFSVRFLGKALNTTTFFGTDFLGGAFAKHRDKIEVVSHADAYDFMTNVSDSHVILPLVDETNFDQKYQSGKKLTSSVMWGIGFHKKMIIYRDLANLFGLQQDNETYWTYENSQESFMMAFGKCLASSHL